MAQGCGIEGSLTFASDPNNNSTLSATGTLGGIRVNWTYPTVNPEALAFVKVFRSTSSNFTSMAQIGTAKGDSYFDALGDVNAGTTFYYWIQIVTINGTVMGLIGPASASFSTSTSQYLAALSGQLEVSSLNSQLQAEIASIQTNRDSILNEGVIRSAIFDSVTLNLNALGIDVTQAFAAIASEQTARVDGDNVLASNISAVIASNTQNLAAIVNEQTARVSADSALAANVTTLEASVLTNQNSINGVPVLISAAIQDFDSTQVGYCMVGGQPNGFYGDKATCEANGGTWLELKALAQAVKGVQIFDGQGSGSIEQRAAVYRDELDVLNANYTVKINANGAVGGFGIGLNSQTNSIDAIFDVGTFALRGAGQGDVYPFAVSNGVTYIKTAVIEDLTIGTIKMGAGAATGIFKKSWSGANVLKYPTTASTTPIWSSTLSKNEASLKAAVDRSGSNWSDGTNFSDLIVNVGGVSGEIYECLVTFCCEVGIKSRNGNTVYQASFVPKLGWDSAGGTNFVYIDMHSVEMKTSSTLNGPVRQAYTFTETILFNANTNPRFRIGEDVGQFVLNTTFGTAYTPIGVVLDYAFMRNANLTIQVVRR